MDASARDIPSSQPQRPAPVGPSTPAGQTAPPSRPTTFNKQGSSKDQQDPSMDNCSHNHNAGDAYEEEQPDMAYGGSHTQSWTWSSPRALQEDLFTVAKVSVERHFRGYDRDIVEALQSFEMWCKHAAVMKSVDIELEKRRIKDKEHYQRLRSENQTHKAFDDRKLSAGMGGVLCHNTLWCKEYKTEWRRLAPWPSIAEQKWEGEDRARTRVGRYFPLPREPSNGSVPWNYLPVVNPTPFDEIWKVPTELDILYPMDQINAEVNHDQHMLLNQEILGAIDLGPNDVWAKDDLPSDEVGSVKRESFALPHR